MKVKTYMGVEINYDAGQDKFIAEVKGKLIRSNRRTIVEKRITELLSKKKDALLTNHYNESIKRVKFIRWKPDGRAEVENDTSIETVSKYGYSLYEVNSKIFEELIEIEQQKKQLAEKRAGLIDKLKRIKKEGE